MRAHYFQHVPFEGLGSVQAWLVANGYQITATRFYEFSELPDLEQIDLLVVMGGPMSVNDEAIYPWLVAEKSFIRTAVQSGKRVLGVCLGAQLIASALGARVYPNAQKEIGWFPIQGIASSERVPFCFPSVIEVFHWHGETFDLPPAQFASPEAAVVKIRRFRLTTQLSACSFIWRRRRNRRDRSLKIVVMN